MHGVHSKDIDLLSGFTCQQCGVEPSVVIMDVTALAFPRSMLKFKSLLITPHHWKSGR